MASPPELDDTRPMDDVARPRRTTPAAGRVGGRYILLHRLGAGGSGEVFAAFDPVLDRRVAVKLLLPSRTESGTLVREGRMLAKLVHPAVVTVHDLGVDADRAYLAMELLEGDDILAFADQARAAGDLDAILDAVLRVGEGLAAAHRTGIVHGDIKPSNVLRARDGRTKLSDFGIAHLAQAPRERGRIVGTPAFLAPEQHDPSNLPAASPEGPAGNAIDQYAFCLTAWILFHGKHPFAAASESRRGTHSLDPDDTSESARDESATSVDLRSLARAQRAWTPRASVRDLPRRIGAALERGLSLDPRERWPDMESLLRALAAPRRRGRRRLVLGLGTALGLAGAWATFDPAKDPCRDSGDAIAQTWGPERADALRASWTGDAKQFGPTLDGVTTTLDAYAEAWVEASRDNCRATHALRTQSGELLDLRARCLGRARRALDEAADVLTTDDETVWLNALDVVSALPQQGRCADIDALLEDRPLPDDPDRAAAVEKGQQKLERSIFQLRAGSPDAAAETLAEVTAQIDALDFPTLSTEYWAVLAEVDLWRADHETAIRHGEIALEHALRWDRPADALDAAGILALSHARSGSIDDAAHYVDMVLALAGREDATNDGRAFAHTAAADLARDQGDFDAAEKHSRAALAYEEASYGPDSAQVATALSDVALSLHQQGRLDEAAPLWERSLALREATLGRWHQQVAQAHHNLALVYGDLDDPRAQGHSRRAVAIATKIFGPVDPRVGQGLNALGSILRDQGRDTEALATYEASLAAFGDRGSSLNAAHARVNYGQLLDKIRRTDDAETQLRRALADQRAIVGDAHPEIARTRIALGVMYSAQSRYDEARLELEAAESIFVDQGRPGHPNRLSAMIARARVERDVGNDARARAILEACAVLMSAAGQVGAELPVLIHTNLAELDFDAGHPDAARDHWQQALDIAVAADTPSPVRLARLHHGLARATWALGDRDRAHAHARTAAIHADRVEGPAGPIWRDRITDWLEHQGASR